MNRTFVNGLCTMVGLLIWVGIVSAVTNKSSTKETVYRPIGTPNLSVIVKGTIPQSVLNTLTNSKTYSSQRMVKQVKRNLSLGRVMSFTITMNTGSLTYIGLQRSLSSFINSSLGDVLGNDIIQDIITRGTERHQGRIVTYTLTIPKMSGQLSISGTKHYLSNNYSILIKSRTTENKATYFHAKSNTPVNKQIPVKTSPFHPEPPDLLLSSPGSSD